MKNTLLAASLLIASNTVVLFAHAEQPYVGLDYQMAQVKGTNTSVNLSSIMLRASTMAMPYLGAEAQIAIGVNSPSFDVSGNSYTLKNEYRYGVYLKPQFTLNDTLDLYALLGANYAKTAQNGVGFSEVRASAAAAGGLGLNLWATKQLGLGADVMLYDKNTKAINVGARYKF